MRLGRISIFHEESDNPRAPVFKGSIEFENGTKNRVSLWREEHPGVNGGEYFSGSIETEQPKRRSGTLEDGDIATTTVTKGLYDDDIPL